MKVSVIIPCYNVGKYIQTCLESVFVQKHDDIEIILVNDGSKDDTVEKIKAIEHKSPFNLVLVNQENKGAPAARNNGLSHATGEYIQFLDADDWIEPLKIKHQIDLAQKADFPHLIIGSSKTQFENGDFIKNDIYSEDKLSPIWLMLMRSDLGNTCANLFNRNLFAKHDIKWNINQKSSQEYDLMFQILKQTENCIFDEEIHTIIRRRDSGSISQVNVKGNRIRFIELRIKILAHIKATLSPSELQSFYQILFDAIRTLYPMDPDKAKEFFKNHIPKGFKPSTSTATTSSYLFAYKFLGFEATEKLKLKFKNFTK